MRCLKLFGHKWGKWTRHLSDLKEGLDGNLYRRETVTRECEHCGFVDTAFTNVAFAVEDKNVSE